MKIENSVRAKTITSILNKHKVKYRVGGYDFVFMIECGIICFEIYDTHETYVTFKGRSHFRVDENCPYEVYEIAEMIGFLQGGK